MVDCLEEAHFETNRVVVRRLDTGEIVQERAMDGEERAVLAQGDLLPADQDGE